MPYNMFLEISVFFGRLLFKMLFIGLITYTKIQQTRSHTDGFQRNNAKCLDEKGISRFVPHSSF